MNKLLAALGALAIALTIALPVTAKQDKVYVCHAAGREGTTHYVTLHVPATESGYPQGHFTNNGTPKAGHEEDYLGPCLEPSAKPSSTPSPTSEPTPSAEPSQPTVTPTPEPTVSPSATPISTPLPTSTPPSSSAGPRKPLPTLPATDTVAAARGADALPLWLIVLVGSSGFVFGMVKRDFMKPKPPVSRPRIIVVSDEE